LDKKVIVTDKFIPRKLSFQHDREAVLIDSAKALADPRLLGRPLMLLGEAGSGKSELLRQWGGSAVATARQVTYGWRPTQGRVFIDGLDEAAGLHDGDALDRLLGVLEAQQNTDFIIACRVADWRSASGKATIKHWTGVDPVEITIEPFGRSEIVQFLKQHNELSQAEAEALAERQRVGRDFADLSTERVQAGLFAERVAAITATASSGHP
jgi:energy-coupling factor transporter ATP-binding protein EcfA2